MLTRPLQENFAIHPGLGSWTWSVQDDLVVWSKPLFELFGLDETNGPPGWGEHHRIFRTDSFEALQSAVSHCLKT